MGRAISLVMRLLPKLVPWLAIIVALATIPAESQAYDRQLVLGADLSYAHELVDESGPGGGVGVHAWYKISDYVAVGGQLAWAGLAADDGEGGAELRNVITAAAGLYYILDIIRIVPYAGLLVGAAVGLQDGVDASYLLQICGGADFLVNPFFTTGLELSYQFLVGESIMPARLVISIRLNWRHMFF
jgi:hypothetical protein